MFATKSDFSFLHVYRNELFRTIILIVFKVLYHIDQIKQTNMQHFCLQTIVFYSLRYLNIEQNRLTLGY